MQEFDFVIGHEHENQRLDVCLVSMFHEEHSRTFIKKLIDSGNVSVNGINENAHYKVASGDEIKILIPDLEPLKVEPENIPLDIVYEDRDLIVVNKPLGMVVHPAPGNYSGTLVNALLYHCKDLSGIGGALRPGIVHRLDKDTTGILVAAKTDNAHKSLSEQIKNRTAERIYIALVKGIVQLDNGIIELPIGRNQKDRFKMDVTYVDARDAVTIYKVLERFKDFTMLEVKLGTGRTHQIRVHLAHYGYPVIGDKAYGYPRGMNRQALHAKRLKFEHPSTGKLMEFETELPKDMKEVISRGHI